MSPVLLMVADNVVATPMVAVLGEIPAGTRFARSITVTGALALAPLQLTRYVIDAVGVTNTLPDVAPPVEKPVPVHDVAFSEDQVSCVERPLSTDVGLAVRAAQGVTTGG